MNVLMCTNTFTPHVGGVARSVEQFTDQFRQRGHRILVVAPEFPDIPAKESGVLRVPAVQHFNGSDFSVPVPVPGMLHAALDRFRPDIVHSHHPFLLGDTALRISASRNIPVVFTHHTQYEKYTHYIPGDSELLKRFAVELAVGYCNLCDAVIAPSRSILERLRNQGVTSEIVEIPTGVDTSVFGRGDGNAWRDRHQVPPSAFIVGHVGRLAPEKGLDFLASAVAKFIASHAGSMFLIAGDGPSAETIRQTFRGRGITGQLIQLGSLPRSQLADVYAAMDVFVFASLSETQGMVLTEAMAASTPVVAIDGPGVREIIQDGVNGRMIPTKDEDTFLDALNWIYSISPDERQQLHSAARQTADEFSLEKTAARVLELYDRLLEQGCMGPWGNDMWSVAKRRIDEELRIWSNVAEAASHALLRDSEPERNV